MTDYSLAFRTGLIYGIVFSCLFSVLLVVLMRINPEGLLDGLPPDIEARYGPVSEKTQRRRKPLMLLFFLILVGVPLLSVRRYGLITDGVPTFFEIFINIFTIFMVFNIVDLLIVDWLVICTITPKFIVLPGTEGMAGYKDYGYHFRGSLKGTVTLLVLALIFAGIISLGYLILGKI
jgi:hypothetical protein